jgi:hypothetical protein
MSGSLHFHLMRIIKDIEIMRASQNHLLIQQPIIKRKWFSNINEHDIEDFTTNYLHLLF